MNDLFGKTLFDEKTLTWRGGSNCPHVFDPKMSIGKAALFVLNQNLDFVAQISDNSGVKRTNREIRDSMLKIAVNLNKIGCTKGDVVGFLSSNNEDVGAAVLASFLLAAPINALDPSFCKDEIVHMFGITRPKFIFCDSAKIPVLNDALVSLQLNAKIIVIGERIGGLIHIEELLKDQEYPRDLNFPEVDDRTCAIILCSSGTTGLPKGVSIPHKTLIYLASYGIIDETESSLSVLCFSSLYWYTGMLTLLTGTLRSLTRIITSHPYTPDLIYKIITKHQPNILFVGPIQVTGILNHPLLDESTMDSIKHFICTGSSIAEPLWEKMRKYLRNGSFCNGYGMSEIGWISRESRKSSSMSVGNIASGIKIKVVDEDGKKLGIGQMGELCMKWELMFLEYYNNPEATTKLLDNDGWVQSGDIGFFDENNLLHIVGRNKEILKYNNFHVSPSEVEDIILTLPGVVQAVVVGVPHPVSRDLPAAVVVRTKGSSVVESDIEVLIEKNLCDAKHLRGGVYFVDTLPLTHSGKIRRAIVKEIATKMHKERNL